MSKEIAEVQLTLGELNNKYTILCKAIDMVLKEKAHELNDKDKTSLKCFLQDTKITFSETQLYVANTFLSDLFFRRISNVVFDSFPYIKNIDDKFISFVISDKTFSDWCETHVPGAAAANKILDSFYDGEYYDELMSFTMKENKNKIIKNFKIQKKETEDVKTKKVRNVVEGEIIANVSKNGDNYVAISIDGKDLTSTVNNQAKLKYAFDNNGVVRGRIKNDALIWRVVKEKFVTNPLPTGEEIEEQITREENEKKQKELEVVSN